MKCTLHIQSCPAPSKSSTKTLTSVYRAVPIMILIYSTITEKCYSWVKLFWRKGTKNKSLSMNAITEKITQNRLVKFFKLEFPLSKPYTCVYCNTISWSHKHTFVQASWMQTCSRQRHDRGMNSFLTKLTVVLQLTHVQMKVCGKRAKTRTYWSLYSTHRFNMYNKV